MDQKQMIEIVTILVRGESFSSKFNTQRIPLKPGDTCLVESSIGLQIGKVLTQSSVVKPRFIDGHLPRVIRKTSQEDIDNLERIIRLEKDATQICLEKITHYRLEMKLVKVIFSFDKSKGLFMFTSDGRVDFRDLVRDLAQYFKTRIEMKQIGIRDEARLIGGIGNCGCTLCCQTFLRDFHSVSIKMAKDQGLSLIPSKISGLCGRLMCCLQYEHEHYSLQARRMPKIGKRVMTPKGTGKVRQLGILKQVVQVELLNGEFEEFKLEDIEFEAKLNKGHICGNNSQPEWNDDIDDNIQSSDDTGNASDKDTDSSDDPNQNPFT
jgi:cell fate regulator YaaT (PSP1 superfamily)